MKKNGASREVTPELVGRDDDVAYIMNCIQEADCCSIVGVSNIGKSTLLRALAQQTSLEKHLGSRAERYLFVYIDLNLALQITEQGFCEVILRNTLELLAKRPSDAELKTTIERAYQQVINPGSPLMVSLAFENSLEAISEQQGRMLVLLFDEFDGIFSQIEPQVFVRMRALKDKHCAQLCYVTATDQLLEETRRERPAGEFCELFEGHTRHLAPLAEADARALVAHWAMQAGVEFSPEDINFVTERAGGHPGLLQTTCRVLNKSREEESWRPKVEGYERVRERLDSDPNVRLECAKLWSDLGKRDQDALLALSGDEGSSLALDSLLEKGIVRRTASGFIVFGKQFADFVQRQRLVRRLEPRGVRIDVEAGDVWVDGKLAPALTELEYKLLLLLYGNLGKICDKYKVVESVWGENYIDEVDDARIEKLVSRLREKIEPNAEEPRYLLTVRGRGYKLVAPE